MSGMSSRARYRPRAAAASQARRFVDREEAFDLFRRTLAEQDPDEQRVLNFYGVGGIGKSRLQHELRELVRTESLALSACIDFQPPAARRQDAALYQLRHGLRTEHGLELPLFDIAYAVYWQRANPNVPLAQRDLPLVADSEILAELVEAGGATPVFGVVVNLIKGLDRLGRRARRWQRVRNDPDLGNLDRLDAHELLDALNFFFARDLLHALEERGERGVIFVDAHEALWEDVTASGGRGDRDAWIRDLIVQTPGVLWTIGSRDALRWAAVAPEWREPYLRQYHVGDLSPEDRMAFLESCGVTGAAAEAIAHASQGVPFYLDVSIDHWHAIRARREPGPDDFGHTQEDLLSRFVGHVPKAEEELLKVLSVARSWDRPLFESLIRRFNIAFALTRWPDFCSYSFNRETSGGRWVMHQLMRSELLRRLDPELRVEVDAAIFDHERMCVDDASRRPAERMQAFREAVIHGLAAARLTPEWFMEAASFFMYRGLWKPMWETTEEMEAALATATGDSAETLRTLRDYLEAWILRQEGHLAEARSAYEALDLGRVEPWEAGIRLEIAHALRESGDLTSAGRVYGELWSRPADRVGNAERHRLAGIQYADFHYVQGRFRDAKAILDGIAALDLDSCAKEVAEAKRILGHVDRFNEREGRGAALYREAGELFESCDDLFGQAIIATNMAEALWPTDPAVALGHATDAVERHEALGCRLEIGKARVAAAYAHLRLGSIAAASREADAAIVIQAEVGYRTGEAQARLARACVRAVDGDDARAGAEALEVGRTLEELQAYPTLRLAAARVALLMGIEQIDQVAGLRARADVQWLEDAAASEARLLALVERTLSGA
jgi:hypothetical protein